jgi:hypothetical protein
MGPRKKHKQKARQSRSGIVLALFACAFFAVLMVASAGLFFKVSEIRVEGVSVIPAEGVRERSGVQLQSNILLLDKFAVSRNIFAAYPYAREVSVRRQLPNVVIITITEAAPACAFEYQGYYWIADRDGRLLENKAALGDLGFPLVKGVTPLAPVLGEEVVFPIGEEDKRYALFPLLDALETNGLLEGVREIDASHSYEMTLLYDGRLEVLLGFPNDLEYKLSYIEPSLARLDAGQRARLDVSSAREKNAYLFPEE